MTTPADARRKVVHTWERCPRDRAVSKLERLAYKRHARDLATGHKRGLYFNDDAADRAVVFIETFCRHSKGVWAGQLIELTRFQHFVVRSIFGWRYIDTGLRRYHYVYLQVARKQGKTTLAAAIAVYMTLADKEAGAENFSAATTKDQARICFDAAAAMVRRSPELSKYLDVFGGKPQSRTNNISCEILGSKFEPLASDEQNLDGLNIHLLVGDELHRWKKREYLDVLETASGSRTQPLRLYITTPGNNPEGVCWEQRDYAVKILEGVVEDDEYLVFMAEPPLDADYTNPKTWEMGNPNLGVTVWKKDLEAECKRAQDDITKQNGFRRYKCGMWVSQAERWLDLAKWDRCAADFDLELLAGRPCFGGLDLASTEDLAAFCLLFPPTDDDPLWFFRWWAWCPEDRIPKLPREQQRPYQQWAERGHLTLTPGDQIDYDFIRKVVNQAAEDYRIEEIGYDPWNATQLVYKLEEEDGMEMVRVTQGVGGMNAASKEFARLVNKGQMRHGGNPVARWCASNIAIWTDANDNIKPSRKNSGGRIDLVVAGIIGLARGMLEDAGVPLYEKRGLA
jgi:phage terminase large subunit-like protein